MSQENVEVVRRAFAFEVYGRGDPAEALADFDPDLVWNPVEEAPSHGPNAVRDYYERWESSWEELQVNAEEFIDAGDRVVVTAYFRGRGRGSGVEVDTRFNEVYTLRDGKIVRIDEFTEREKALEAAGLGK
jgi:ketosteroid isomerase-like protein